MDKTLKLDLIAPEQPLFSEEVVQVDIPGTEGDFVILAEHAPVMAILRPGIVSITRSKTQKADTENHLQYFVRGGFVDHAADKLTVLAENAFSLADASDDMLLQTQADIKENMNEMSDEARAAAERACLLLDDLRRTRSQ